MYKIIVNYKTGCTEEIYDIPTFEYGIALVKKLAHDPNIRGVPLLREQGNMWWRNNDRNRS